MRRPFGAVSPPEPRTARPRKPRQGSYSDISTKPANASRSLPQHPNRDPEALAQKAQSLGFEQLAANAGLTTDDVA